MATQLHCIIKRNIMGGGNVVVYAVGESRRWHDGSLVPFHVASYATVSNARRAVRSGAALRRAVAVEYAS